MELIAPQVGAYLDQLVPPRHPVLQEWEASAAKSNFPIIGPASGNLCYLLTRILNARSIFELGSGFGYSTAWFARGVKENGGGTVHHVVWEENLSERARKALATMELSEQVQFHVGEAVATLEATPGPFDIIFNDIDKHGYPDALRAIMKKLRVGGVIIADNLLWHGRIFDPADQTPDTVGIREFTRLVGEDSRLVSSIVPIRDGVLVAVRTS